MKTHETRIKNDIEALRFVHSFGWLRIVELGTLMKPKTATSLEAGARLARNLIARHLVLSRRLPEGAGQALVLATAGVRLLAEHGISAASGKSIGQTAGERWTPPSTWKHDVLAHGVLCELFKRGYKILPEAEIRRRAVAFTKLPDGLAKEPGAQGRWLWLEVENARKSGPNMKHMADAIAAVSSGHVVLLGIRPTACLVAYWRNSVDERGHRLNHRNRVANAVATVSKVDVELMFASVTRKGAAGVGNVDLSKVTIASDRASAILKRLDANGWILDGDEVWRAQYGERTALVWDQPELGGWHYMLENAGKAVAPATSAENISAAKRGVAALIASL